MIFNRTNIYESKIKDENNIIDQSGKRDFYFKDFYQSGKRDFYFKDFYHSVIKSLFTIIALSVISVGTTAYADDLEESDELYGDEYVKTAEDSVADPFYWFNYGMYSFNDKLYFWVLKPAAQGYRFITPAQLRNGLKNFFHNALFPLRFANNLLQGKGDRAFDETKSFIINTVGGGLGFATPAQYAFGINTYNEDFGQTLGHYSLKEGIYLVLPLFGPSTLRDSLGAAGDFFLSPVNYIDSTKVSFGLTALETINGVSLRIGDYETLKQAALDPYISLKDAYIQMRRKQVKE